MALLGVVARAQDRVQIVQVAEALLRLDRVVGHELAARVTDDRLDARGELGADGDRPVALGGEDLLPLAGVVGEVADRLAVQAADRVKRAAAGERELRERRS